MGFEFKFPDVGEGITEGKLVKWLVKVGDTVKKDGNVAKVETDKAVVEIPCPESGVVEKLLFKEGDTLEVGKTIMLLKTAGEALQDEKPGPEEKIESKADVKEEQSKAKPVETRGVLALPVVKKYAKEKNVDLSKVKGTGKEGRITKKDVDAFLGGKSVEKATETRAEEKTVEQSSRQDIDEVLATPSTRKHARELGVDISKVKGTGKNGIITLEDVERASKGITSEPQKTEFEASINQSKSVVEGNVERVPLSNIRETIAKKMVESKHKAAHVTHTDEADVTSLVSIVEKERAALEKEGVKLTFLPFFIKASILALKEHPYLNSELDEEKKEITLKKYYNIGIAVDTEKGLMVPVIKDADKKSIAGLAKEIVGLAVKARDKGLTLADMSNGSFTITNVGSLGGQVFTPIINYPQAAILGVGKIIDKPVAKNNEVVIRKMVMLSLSYDHRVVDGAEAARFLGKIIKYLEDPDLMLLEG